MKAEEKNMIDIVKFGAVGDGALCFEHLYGGDVFAHREADDAGDLHLRHSCG